MKSSLAFGLLLAALSVLNGCASFDNQPINAAQTAMQLDNRRLTQPELQQFIHELTGQTPPRWSLNTLTLVALYYHSDVALAEAIADSAAAAIITAKQRPNPSLSLSSMWISHLATTAMPWILTSSLNIPIETAGKRDFRIDRAMQLSDAARWRVSDALWAVRARLRAAMLALYSEQENLKLARQVLRIEQEIAEHTLQ